MSDEQITIGEVHRICLEIRADVRAQNGKVNDHETRLTVLEDRGTRDPTARATGIGGALAAAGTFLYQWFGK